MDECAQLLRAYDEQLRTDAETAGALWTSRLGPLRLAKFRADEGFITYRDLGGADAAGIRGLVERALAEFVHDQQVAVVEWKTRAHDVAPGLDEALVANGFVAGEPESIMVGRAAALTEPVPLPPGVTLRQVSDEADVRAMCALQNEVFGGPVNQSGADALLERFSRGDDFELWVAEADGRMVSAGRLDPVAGTKFAGIWGGATLPAWRGRGIYRALTAARARSAVRRGKTLINSDSTEFSRPILERSGLIKVSTTTPYEWHRT